MSSWARSPTTCGLPSLRRTTTSCGRYSRRSMHSTGSSHYPTASTPWSDRAACILTPAQAQQIALARLVLADPHTLVLDEATSLLDPRAARRLERSLAAVVEGRTVIAIAHRLHTAHDADRVAVMVGGRIVELGSHDELIAKGGSYADLWASWHGAGPSSSGRTVSASGQHWTPSDLSSHTD